MRTKLKWFLATHHLFLVAATLANHGAHEQHRRLNPRSPSPQNTAPLGQENLPITTRTARLRATLPIFELYFGQSSEYELGRALEEYMLVRGRPLFMMVYNVEPDLAMFNWMAYEKARRVLSGTPPITQPPLVPLDTPSYLDVYIYIGTHRSYRLRTVLGIIIRGRNATTTLTSAPTITRDPTNEQVPQPRGVVLGMLIGACVLFAFLILGGLGWIIAMRGYFKQNRHPVAQPRDSSRAQTHHPNSHSLPSTSNSASITSTRRRVRTADHGTPSSSRSALQMSPERTEESAPPSTRKRAATLLQTIHTRAAHGTPKIGFGSSGTNKASPSLDTSSTTARKGFSPRIGLGQFSPRLGFGQSSPKLEIEDHPNGSLAVMIEESPGLVSSWSSALRLDPFHSPEHEDDSVNSPARNENLVSPIGEHKRPASPTGNKGLCAGGNKTMSVSELFRSGVVIDTTVDDSGVSSDRYEHTGNLAFMDHASAQSGTSTQVTPQAPATLSRAESYAERTNQLSMALISPPTSMHAKPTNGTLGMSFDSFFSPVTERPLPEPRYGEVLSERMVKVGHSQETLTTAYVTASESGVSPHGGQTERDSSTFGHGILEHTETIGSPSTLHSQVVELDGIVSPSIMVGAVEVTSREKSSKETLSEGNSNQSLSVEYGRADRSLRALDSFPAMLRGSLSCFPEDVSLNTPILPSSSTNRSELTHREAYDITLLPADDLAQGCLVLTRVDDESGEHEESMGPGDDTGGLSFMVAEEASNLVPRSEEDSILSPDLSEHVTEQSDSIISHEQDSNMRSSVDSIMSGRQAERSSNGLKYASQLFLTPDN